MKSPEPGNKAQRKVEELLQKLLTENQYRKLSAEIITKNHELVYQSRGKCEIYRDTGVSKNYILIAFTQVVWAYPSTTSKPLIIYRT